MFSDVKLGRRARSIIVTMVMVFAPTHCTPCYLPMLSAICLMQGVAIGLIPDAILNGMTRRAVLAAE